MAKGKRRGRGEGTVYQRKDGRWVAEITLEDGKRKPLYGKTQAEAIGKRDKALLEQKQGILATGPKQRLDSYLERWLEEVCKPTVRLSTYIKYRGILKNHLNPTLGHIQIQKLTAQQVQTLYARKVKDGLSPKMVRLIHVVLREALKNAKRWRIISYNVCEDVSLPRQTRKEIHPLTREQAHALLEAARGHRLETMLTLALTTGMRRGEILALRWSDISFEEKRLFVRRTVDRLSGHSFVESEPKTQKGRRTITLPQFVLETLLQQRVHVDAAKEKAKTKWVDHDLVFPNGIGGFTDPVCLGRWFKKLLKEAGLPGIRFHDLRHSAATILLSMGANPKVVQELLGHSSIVMTMDIYDHVLPLMQRDEMDKWDDLF